METTENACCICGNFEGSAFASGWDFEYGTTRDEFGFVRCSGCGHVYLNPRPDESELGVIYPSDYYSYDLKKSVNAIALKAKHWLEGRKLRYLLGFTKESEPQCLDVGCGDGRLLETLHGLGVPKEKLSGVELDEGVVEGLRDRGFQGHFGRIEDVELDAGSYDLILLFQVIEHVSDPSELMKTLSRLLRPGGVLVVETPNVESLDAWIFRRRYWGGYHFPRHWNLFRKESLGALGKQAGLKSARTETFVCAVFWIYPFHHWLRERGFPRIVYRFFWPTTNPLLLAMATLLDIPLAALGKSSNLRGVFVK